MCEDDGERWFSQAMAGKSVAEGNEKSEVNGNRTFLSQLARISPGLSECGVVASIPFFRTALAITLLRWGNSDAAVKTIAKGSLTRPVETLVASHANACAGELNRSCELLERLPKILSFSQGAIRDEIYAQYIEKSGAQHDFEWLIDQHILLLLAA